MHTLAFRRRKKILSVIIPLIITTIIWVFAKDARGQDITWDYILVFISQLFALWGIVLLAISYLMVTRIQFLENFFGGLDKVYHFHKDISKIAFVLVLSHPILLAINSFSDLDYVKTLFLFPDSNAKAFGIFSLYLFSLLILLTFLKRLPYNIWKLSHQLMGIPFLLGSLHALKAESDIKYYEPMRNWILIWIIIGLFAYIYKLILYKYLGPKHTYKVSEFKKLNDDTSEIYLKPLKSRMNYEPGEFVFLSFKNHEWISPEQHPFTISSSPTKDYLRISYKECGDYTHALAHAEEDNRVEVYGPYGEFTSYVFNSYKKQIWIAGGIGVTPFLSMLDYESRNEDSKNIHFFYCNRNSEDAVYDGEIQEIMKNSDDEINYSSWLSSEKGRITATKISENVENIEDYLILLCGPEKMMRHLQDQFVKKGVSKDMIVFEDFGFK